MNLENKSILIGGASAAAVSVVLTAAGFPSLGRGCLIGGALGVFNLWLIGYVIRRLTPGRRQAVWASFIFLLKWLLLAGGMLAALKAGLSAWGLLVGFTVILATLAFAGLSLPHVRRS